jgi:AcrR family transcriptional regulator
LVVDGATVRTQGIRPAVPLSRSRVLEVATRVVDEHGAAALTMRGLAAELGVSKSAVTWHVGDRPELLAQIGGTWLGTIVPPAGDSDWLGWITDLAHAYRAAAHRHPHLARLAIDGLSATTATGSLAVPEAIVAHLSTSGLPAADQTHAYNAVLATTLGFVALELASGPAAAVAPDFGAIDEAQAPAIAGNVDRLRDEAFGLAPTAARFDAAFAYAISLLTDALSRRQERRRNPSQS